jgi:hypothetical protein
MLTKEATIMMTRAITGIMCAILVLTVFQPSPATVAGKSPEATQLDRDVGELFSHLLRRA